MADDLTQSVRDAIALSTLVADAAETDQPDWSEALVFARECLEDQGERLVMAQAHLLVQTLTALRDVVNGLPDDVDVMGVERPISVSDLIGQLGADAARYEDDGPN